MSKPTPGPWYPMANSWNTTTVYANNRKSQSRICELRLDIDDDAEEVPPELQAEHEANARLIAAAPELYETLKGFMDIWGSSDANSDSERARKRRADLWDKASIAIGKVEGQANDY